MTRERNLSPRKVNLYSSKYSGKLRSEYIVDQKTYKFIQILYSYNSNNNASRIDDQYSTEIHTVYCVIYHMLPARQENIHYFTLMKVNQCY